MREASAEIPFSGNPLDRASQLRGDAEWQAARLSAPGSRFLGMLGGRAPVTGDPVRLSFVAREVIEALKPPGPPVFLGLLNDVAHYAVDLPLAAEVEAALAAAAGRLIDMRALAGAAPEGEAAIGAQAKAILDWHARHRFCANCGQPTRIVQAGWSRACPSCAAQHFPRTDPVVIMLVARGDHCVLARQSRFGAGFRSVLAGFVEPGETVEEAVRRETMEEVGLKAGLVRYHASQPWPFPSSLMIGCYAQTRDETINLIDDELEEAGWFHRDEVARVLAGDAGAGFNLPVQSAIAHHLLKAWVGRVFD